MKKNQNRTVTNTKFWYWLVACLPKTVVYFCFMHVMVHSTTGKHEKTVVPELTGMDAIKRYGDDMGVQ